MYHIIVGMCVVIWTVNSLLLLSFDTNELSVAHILSQFQFNVVKRCVSFKQFKCNLQQNGNEKSLIFC